MKKIVIKIKYAPGPRRVWGVNPVQRVKGSNKVYDRNAVKREFRKSLCE